MKKHRERKLAALRNNAAVQFSLKKGAPHGEYIGMPPAYRQMADGTVRKVRPGVPFVRKERAVQRA